MGLEEVEKAAETSGAKGTEENGEEANQIFT